MSSASDLAIMNFWLLKKLYPKKKKKIISIIRVRRCAPKCGGLQVCHRLGHHSLVSHRSSE